jgi:VanZ family protein
MNLIVKKSMILFTYLVIITLLSLLPSSTLHITEALFFPHVDKVVHFGMYAILTFLLFYTWPEKFNGKFKQYLPLLYVFIWGTLMELFQGLGGQGRAFSYLDILANTIGFLPGWLGWSWYAGKKYPSQPVQPD